VRLGDLRSGATFIGFAREMFPGVDANVRYNFRDTFHTEFLARGAGADEDESTVSIGTLVGSFSTASSGSGSTMPWCQAVVSRSAWAQNWPCPAFLSTMGLTHSSS